MDMRYQRRLAAKLLKCGEHRVWIDPERREDVAKSATRTDIRTMINAGAIQALPEKGTSRGRINYRRLQKQSGRRRGQGSRRGAKHARTPKKRQWIQKIRPIRAMLRELRDSGKISTRVYRQFYLQAKGGVFKSKAHLETQLRMQGYLKEA
ncbi:MAG: 50S ribosomal protein L19e [Candidatus Thermoplasmatota archaeon]